MGVCKISKSGKQVQFITDEGDMYVTSAAYLKSLLYGHMKLPFIQLGKYPNKTDVSRFKKSEIYDPSGRYTKEYTAGKDAFSASEQKKKAQKDTYSDLGDF